MQIYLKSGIYKITNTVNGHIYIGSSSVLKKRLYEHKRTLKNNTHKNPHLQSSYNKYGDVFIYEILFYCSNKDLIFYEQRAVDKLNPEYNIRRECVATTLGIKRPDLAARNRLGMSEISKEKLRGPRGKQLIPWTDEHRANHKAAQQNRKYNV